MMTVHEGHALPRATPALVASLFIFFLFCAWTDRSVSAEEERPCAEDIAKFCKDVKPGGGRIITCLKGHEGELSPLCKDRLWESQKRLDEAKRVCASDIEKFCKDVEPGEGRIARCLEKYTADLSPACAKKLNWVKSRLTGK